MIVPQIKNLQKKEKIQITIYEGQEGFITAIKNASLDMPKRGTIYVIGAGGPKWRDVFGNQLNKYENMRYAKKLLRKMLVYENLRGKLDKIYGREYEEIRYLPDEFDNPIGTTVYGQKTLILVYSDPPMVIEIINKEVRENILNYFNLLWKIAKK